MLALHDSQSMKLAMLLHFEPELHTLLAHRICDLSPELQERTCYLVVEDGDTEADLIEELGHCPIEIVDGVPSWDWLYDHGGWLEAGQTIGDSGFCYVTFIEDGSGWLAELCREHAEIPPSYMKGDR